MSNTCFMDNRESWTAVYKTLAVMPNHFPIGPLAVLMFPTVHRAKLQPEDLASAMEFARHFPDYLVFHNMAGSGASRPDHVHLQGFLRSEPYPIERAARVPLFSVRETSVTRLEDYPVYGLAVKGRHPVEVVFSIIDEYQGGDAKKPFNLILTVGEIVFVPRSVERPTGFSGAFAGLEVSGGIVLTDEQQYNSLTADDVHGAISECGIDAWAQVGLESSLRCRFSC